MRICRILSHIAVASLLATLVSVQVTSAYPIQGQTPAHDPAIHNSDSLSTTSTSEHETYKWLDFEVAIPPEFNMVDYPKHDWEFRTDLVQTLKKHREMLKIWLSHNRAGLQEDTVFNCQQAILYGLWGLTRIDRHRAGRPPMPAFKPEILKRMLGALQMHETPLSRGTYEDTLKDHIGTILACYDGLLKTMYGAHYDFTNYQTLTHKVELELGIMHQ